jgi:ubiquinone/menaquinone biosynthesis C-methylase UbiE
MPALPLTGPNVDLDDFHKDATPNIHQQARYNLIKRLLTKVPKHGKALDYGCGMGDVTHTVSGHFDSIVGVDVTPDRIQWANKHYAPLQFEVCDSATLAFPDASFDTVLSSVVINWTDSPVLYLANIRRVLVKGGNLLIVLKGTMPIRTWVRSKLSSELKPRAGMTPISPTQFSGMLGSDFKIIATDCFYEPVEAPLTIKKMVFEVIQVPFKLFRSRNHAAYFAVLAKKVN